MVHKLFRLDFFVGQYGESVFLNCGAIFQIRKCQGVSASSLDMERLGEIVAETMGSGHGCMLKNACERPIEICMFANIGCLRAPSRWLFARLLLSL